MPSQYTAAVIGCGRMGHLADVGGPVVGILTGVPTSHLAAYAQHPRIRVAAVCDADPARAHAAAARYHVPRVYTDYHAMLREGPYDIVSICLPTPLHAPACIAAARAGVRAVFCEKPIATSLTEARAMIAACAEHGTLLAVNHSRRWDARYRAARDFLATSCIGTISSMVAFAPVGLANSGTHLFDLLRWYGGDIAWVQASLLPDASGDPGGVGVVAFRSGIRCTVDSSWREYLLFGVEVYGTDGVLRVGGATHTGATLTWSRADRRTSSTAIAPLVAQECAVPDGVPPIQAAVDNIVDVIEHRSTLACTGEDGAAALEVVVAFHQSSANHEARIALPLADAYSTMTIRPRATSFSKDGQLV